MKDFQYIFDIAEAQTKLFDKETQPLSWGYQQGVFETLKEIKEWLIKHDAETKTPLEDEIERLKNKLADLTEEYELTVEAFDREYATQNVQLRKAFNERNNERLKVIAELEEWCDINEQFGVHNEKFIKDLQQKLKEMKGE